MCRAGFSHVRVCADVLGVLQIEHGLLRYVERVGHIERVEYVEHVAADVRSGLESKHGSQQSEVD